MHSRSALPENQTPAAEWSPPLPLHESQLCPNAAWSQYITEDTSIRQVVLLQTSPLLQGHCLCSLSYFQGPRSRLFYRPISNLLISWYFLNTFLTLCWLLISFHLHLKGIPLLYILIKSHWSAVVSQCSGVQLSSVPAHKPSYDIGEKNLWTPEIWIFKAGLPISNDFILPVSEDVPCFLPLVCFLRWHVLKKTKGNMHPETSVFLRVSLQQLVKKV